MLDDKDTFHNDWIIGLAQERPNQVLNVIKSMITNIWTQPWSLGKTVPSRHARIKDVLIRNQTRIDTALEWRKHHEQT